MGPSIWGMHVLVENGWSFCMGISGRTNWPLRAGYGRTPRLWGMSFSAALIRECKGWRPVMRVAQGSWLSNTVLSLLGLPKWTALTKKSHLVRNVASFHCPSLKTLFSDPNASLIYSFIPYFCPRPFPHAVPPTVHTHTTPSATTLTPQILSLSLNVISSNLPSSPTPLFCIRLPDHLPSNCHQVGILFVWVSPRLEYMASGASMVLNASWAWHICWINSSKMSVPPAVTCVLSGHSS
jgi:hypothetical protein